MRKIKYTIYDSEVCAYYCGCDNKMINYGSFGVAFLFDDLIIARRILKLLKEKGYNTSFAKIHKIVIEGNIW